MNVTFITQIRQVDRPIFDRQRLFCVLSHKFGLPRASPPARPFNGALPPNTHPDPRRKGQHSTAILLTAATGPPDTVLMSTPPSPQSPRSTPDSARRTHLLPRRSALRSFSALAALASTGALTGCGSTPDKDRDDALAKIEWLPSEVDTESVSLDQQRATTAVTACNAVGATMLSTLLRKDGSSNALSCPVGITFILALLYAGAENVGEGVNAALGVKADAEAQTRDTTWSAVKQTLQRFDVTDIQQLRDFDPEAIPEAPLLHVANNIMIVDDKTVVRQEYLDNAKRWYDSEIGRIRNPDAKAALDAWATLHTGGLIKESGIDITSDTRLVLQNALLFAARWATPFKAEETEKGAQFTLADGSSSTADLMTDTNAYPLVTGTGWRALRLPYTGGADSSNLAMDVILPDNVVSPADLLASTWGEATAALTAATAEQQVALKLPKLDLASGVMDLFPVLTAMGVELGSLDHIAEDIDANQAAQQVRLIVDEEGTVAAALTEIGIEASAVDSSSTVEFTVDHPYVLRIVDLASGVAIIEAAILNPAG